MSQTHKAYMNGILNTSCALNVTIYFNAPAKNTLFK